VTGFRFNFGGVCNSFDIDPDLITFGKIIGGGTPVGAYAGKTRFMQNVAIGNTVFQSGTFAANPLTMAAGNATLDVLARPGFYQDLETKGALLESSLKTQFAAKGIPFQVTRHGALVGVAFRDSDVPMQSYKDVKTQQYEVFKSVHQKLLARGFLIAPSLEEPLFLSAAHSRDELGSLAAAMAESIEAAMPDHAAPRQQAMLPI
jgi:glutamate-1-semialdehyde 2,1-aminomutase